MSEKKYNYNTGKYKGCNKTHGWLLSVEQISAVKYFLFLAGLEFKFDAKRKLRNGEPKKFVMNELRKYRETTALYADLEKLIPYSYVRA